MLLERKGGGEGGGWKEGVESMWLFLESVVGEKGRLEIYVCCPYMHFVCAVAARLCSIGVGYMACA